MDEFIRAERRLVLVALWRFRESLGKAFDEAGSDDSIDAVLELETMEALDSAAVKVGGDPAKAALRRP